MEFIYDKLLSLTQSIAPMLTPYFRRVIRFLALPYCYQQINWNECRIPRWNVIKDLLYVFFVLKYYPDNYSQCRFFEKDRSSWKYYYGSIYDPYQRAALRKEVQRSEYIILFDDKEVCARLCQAFDLPQPSFLGIIDEHDTCRERIRESLDTAVRKIIIKPVRGKGGKGIHVAHIENGDIHVTYRDQRLPIDALTIEARSIIQQYVPQHEALNRIAPHSINTIRIQTLLTRDNDILIVGAMIRFGIDETVVDNLSSGGIGIGIDTESGTLMEQAHDFASRTYTRHPTSDVELLGYEVPCWPEVVKLATRIQSCFPYYRFLGHDIAITPDGPVIIEINPEPDNVMIEQCYGPILEDPEVLKAFREYDLLINRPSAAIPVHA